jgi:hypothetical protein
MTKTNETPTSGIFYCRISTETSGSGSIETSSWLDSAVLRNRQQKHTAVSHAGRSSSFQQNHL